MPLLSIAWEFPSYFYILDSLSTGLQSYPDFFGQLSTIFEIFGHQKWSSFGPFQFYSHFFLRIAKRPKVGTLLEAEYLKTDEELTQNHPGWICSPIDKESKKIQTELTNSQLSLRYRYHKNEFVYAKIRVFIFSIKTHLWAFAQSYLGHVVELEAENSANGSLR